MHKGKNKTLWVSNDDLPVYEDFALLTQGHTSRAICAMMLEWLNKEDPKRRRAKALRKLRSHLADGSTDSEAR